MKRKQNSSYKINCSIWKWDFSYGATLNLHSGSFHKSEDQLTSRGDSKWSCVEDFLKRSFPWMETCFTWGLCFLLFLDWIHFAIPLLKAETLWNGGREANSRCNQSCTMSPICCLESIFFQVGSHTVHLLEEHYSIWPSTYPIYSNPDWTICEETHKGSFPSINSLYAPPKASRLQVPTFLGYI